MANAKRDDNRIAGLLAETDNSDRTITPLKVDPDTGRLLVKIVSLDGTGGTAGAQAKRDANRVVGLVAETDNADRTITPLTVNATGSGLLVSV